MGTKLKKIARPALGIFFILAGFNHCLMPDFYLPLIPPYLPCPEWINLGAGVVEIGLGAGVLLPAFRYAACLGILLLLLLFIPSHVHFIAIGSCVEGGLCVPPLVGWSRLLFIHPLLMAWAWWCRK
jgi:uncharacterized membrane protein